MKNYLCPLTFVLCCAATTSLACKPTPGETFDSLSSIDAIVGIADVLTTEIGRVDGGGSCISLSYSGVDSIHGSLPASFQVKSCVEDANFVDWVNLKEANEAGFVAGAVVLVGLIQVEQAHPTFRYAVPNCWGPLHIRLDNMTEEDQTELVSALRNNPDKPE